MTHTGWACPKCKRHFTRANQRHACGIGDRAGLLRNRPEALATLFDSLEAFVKSLGKVELVTRDRYVLFRTRRIFADLAVMTDALRLAIHLPTPVVHPLFFKTAADARHVTHVAKLRTEAELAQLQGFLREAYAHSLRG